MKRGIWQRILWAVECGQKLPFAMADDMRWINEVDGWFSPHSS
ncbi:hypothetical protein [Fibrobacter intestinalis]|nr:MULTISPECIES: hypothetical protein [Fibrobacter]